MKILYIMSSFNLYGGTPKKTLDLMKHFDKNSVLYVYSKSGQEKYKKFFEKSGGGIYSPSSNNLFKQVNDLLKIIDKEKINIVQTQFFKGELLGFFIKLFRPNLKLVIAFVGPFSYKGIKNFIANYIYRYVDSLIFISNYVKEEKVKQFNILKNKNSRVIYNGTNKREGKNRHQLKGLSLFSLSGLVEWKNIDILIEAFNILINQKKYKDIYLYIAGDGPERENLKSKIKKYKLENNIFLLGYRDDVGDLLEETDIYVHPAYAEGFGIAIAEAMMAKRSIIVSNKGALPELIEDGVSGLVVDAFDKVAWVNAIEYLINNSKKRDTLGNNSYKRAIEKFLVNSFVENYEKFYKDVLNEK